MHIPGTRMKLPTRLLTPALIVTAIAALSSGSWAVTPAHASGPKTGPVFNDPTGTPDQQTRIVRRLMNAINGAEPGSIIRMAFFSFSMEEFADSLIAANARGVHVRLIMDDHEIRPPWERLVAALGTDATTGSFAILCHRSCFTDKEPSYLHTKLYMFSSSRGVSRVVTIASANPTYFQARRGWNNGYTIVENKTFYAKFERIFGMLAAGALEPDQPIIRPDTYEAFTSGRHKFYVYPKAEGGAANDTMFQILSNVRCTGTATGYGSQGKTIVKVAMYQWSMLRLRLATKLWELDDKGCKVEILYDPMVVDAEILAALRLKGGRNGNPTLIPASIDKNADGVPDLLLHDKFVLVDGKYLTDSSSRLVFTGSANWTHNSMHYNNELMLKISGSSTHEAFLSHYVKVRTWAKTLATQSGGITTMGADSDPAPSETMPPGAD